ncbi:hypothetical protein P9423_22675, partial [Enterobacter mori]
TVTVTLKDAHENAVTGQAAVLQTAVNVPNATGGGDWTESGTGTYTATYTANTAATGLKAALKLTGWTGSKQSDTYDIVANKITGLIADGHEFGPDEGFPTTGFNGATFTIKLGNGSPGDYAWTASPGWVTVSDKGDVTLNQGEPGTVKITGTRRDGGGTALEYAFVVKHWFSAHEQEQPTDADVGQVCADRGAGHGPVKVVVEGGGSVRGVGSLGSEWNGEAVRGLIEAKRSTAVSTTTGKTRDWDEPAVSASYDDAGTLELGKLGYHSTRGLEHQGSVIDIGGGMKWKGDYVCQSD